MISRTVHELSALTNKPQKQTHTQTDTTENNAYHLATLSLSCVLAKMFHDRILSVYNFAAVTLYIITSHKTDCNSAF